MPSRGGSLRYYCRRLVKRKRALLGSNPPRNSRLETHSDGWEPIGTGRLPRPGVPKPPSSQAIGAGVPGGERHDMCLADYWTASKSKLSRVLPGGNRASARWRSSRRRLRSAISCSEGGLPAPFVFLAQVAAQTARIRLGTGIITFSHTGSADRST